MPHHFPQAHTYFTLTVVEEPQPLEAPLLIELERWEQRLPLLKELQQRVQSFFLSEADL